MIYRFRTVIPDKLYRGGNLSVKDVEMLKNKFNITRIVSLDKEVAKRIDRTTKLLNIEHIIIPLDMTRKSLIKLFKYNLGELLGTGKVFVGCKCGKDRTGLVVALFKCKYMKMDPQKALDEAKSLGFGIGIHPGIKKLFEKLILSCGKPPKDHNSADIVSNERTYIGDNRDSFLDEGHQGSFSPYLDHTRQNPMDAVYPNTLDQSPTRENYQTDWNDNKKQLENLKQNTESTPLVGIYNNDAGIHGAGPAEPVGGFIYD